VETTPAALFIDIWVDPGLCIGCGECVTQCSMGVFEMDGNNAFPMHREICVGCFKCLEFCPNHAIQTRWILRVA
jgi:NAD-dependent dihydropyrimidine dehydrogenase PreA subunit